MELPTTELWVLVIGSDGRGHALVLKIRQSPAVKAIYYTGTNAGMGQIAESIPLNPKDFKGVAQFCKEKGINLVVIGPEDPLANGIVDFLHKEVSGIKVFGPNKQAAQLEASKIFAKYFMVEYGIPTAPFMVFDKNEREATSIYIAQKQLPFVIKADGLCGGKGVYPCLKWPAPVKALQEIMDDKKFGDAGDRIIVEDFLRGEEVSYICLTDGQTIMPLLSSQDHKRLLDNDQGPNTGGMGAYCPAPIMTPALEKKVRQQILLPFLDGLKQEGLDYRAAIYFGLMIVNNEPFVLEFNVRFGDPETQPTLFLMESDIVPYLLACCDGMLRFMPPLKWKKGVAVTVVLASAGYPDAPETGKIICGLEDLKIRKDVFVFHAGTRQQGEIVYSTGGRVLGITAIGDDYRDAIRKAYGAVDMIDFTGMQFRKDIGARALAYISKLERDLANSM